MASFREFLSPRSSSTFARMSAGGARVTPSTPGEPAVVSFLCLKWRVFPLPARFALGLSTRKAVLTAELSDGETRHIELAYAGGRALSFCRNAVSA